MPHRLYTLLRHWLDFTQQVSGLHRPRRDGRYGVDIADHLIATAVYLGTIENTEMTATELETASGLPRPTVIRRLEKLERSGAVERRGLTWRIPLARMLELEGRNLETISAMIRAYAAELDR